MRRKFGKIICNLAKKDSKIILLVGDIGYGIFDEFRQKYPSRFFNMGICEQSLIGAASGMALQGLKPWVYTITPFLIERPFEQIKLDIDQQKVLFWGDEFLYKNTQLATCFIQMLGCSLKFCSSSNHTTSLLNNLISWGYSEEFIPAFVNMRVGSFFITIGAEATI